MTHAQDKVIAGDYNGEAVRSVLGEVSIPSSSGRPLFLSVDTVESYEMILGEHLESEAPGINSQLMGGALPDNVAQRLAEVMAAKNKRIQYIALQFKDGKKSLLEVDRDLCIVLIKNCLARAAARCGVTPDRIKSCDPRNEGICRECPCFRCVVWPKCCYRRISDRRSKARNTVVLEGD